MVAYSKYRDNERLIRASYAARLLGVTSYTIGRWADVGILPSIRILPSGHRRYRLEDVMALSEIDDVVVYCPLCVAEVAAANVRTRDEPTAAASADAATETSGRRPIRE